MAISSLPHPTLVQTQPEDPETPTAARRSQRRAPAGYPVSTGVKAGFVDTLSRYIPRSLLTYG